VFTPALSILILDLIAAGKPKLDLNSDNKKLVYFSKISDHTA